MSSQPTDPAHGQIASHIALERLRWWGLLGALWTAYAAAQAAMATVALKGGVEVFLYAALLYGTTAWLWVATTPLLVAFARRLEWRGWRGARGHSIRVVALHAAMMLVVAGVHAAWWRFAIVAFTGQAVPPPFVRVYVARFDLHLFTYLAIVIAVYVASHWRRVAASQLRAARVEAKLVATRLHVLMMQLQPHFLFNTLHSISELVHRDGAGARRTLGHLRDLLQFSFDQSRRAEVSLHDELRFLETYMEIQRTRFGDRLTFEFAIEPDAASALVPCMVLQPLVENAIRHGTAPLGERGHIVIAARRSGDWLELGVRDNGRGPGIRPREGQGLGNTRVRLAELYGSRQQLDLRALPRGGTEAQVVLPYHEKTGGLDERSAVAEQRDTDASDGSRRTHDARRRTAMLIVAAWTFFGLLWAAQGALAGALAGWPTPPLRVMLATNLANACAWALLTGIIIVAVGRWPARREGWPARLALHATFALVASGVLLVGRWLATDPTSPLITLAQTGWFGWDVMTYCVVAGYAHAAHLATQRRERDLRLAVLEAELASAELDVLKWHLQPAFLIETLEDIAAVSATDPDRADDMTTSLGALLRLLMQHVRSADSTVADELAIARAYLDIQSLRLRTDLSATVAASPDVLETRVPGVLLLPIVEELIGPGADAPRGRGPLELGFDARCARGTLVLSVRCRGNALAAPTLAAGGPVDAASDGAENGLLRVRSRLAAAYGDRYRLVIDDSGSAERGITIVIPVSSAGEADAPPPLQRAGVAR